ncbi:MAG: lipopolysaccharide biosynthesis protein [Pseudomonadota bacterium]
MSSTDTSLAPPGGKAAARTADFEDVVPPCLTQLRWPRPRDLLRSPSLLALADQGLVSATRFATSIIIGRFCGPSELGQYAVVFAILLLALCTQEAVVARPYTIYRQHLSGPALRLYSGSVLAHHGVFACTFALLACAGAGTLHLAQDGPAHLSAVMLLMAALVPFTLVWDLARRLAFARLQMGHAVLLDLTLAALQLGGLLVLAWLGSLSLITAMAVIAAVTGLVGVATIALRRHEFLVEQAAAARDWSRNWSFGRWVLAGQIAGTLHGYAVPWVLTLTLGAKLTGIFVAAQTIALLTNPLILGLSNWLAPRSAQELTATGHRGAARVVWGATAAVAVTMAAFALATMIFGELLLVLVFGRQYAGYGALVGLFGICTIPWGIATSVSTGLVALGRTRALFQGTVSGLSATLALVVPLSLNWQLTGAALALLAGSTISALYFLITFHGELRRLERSGAPG